MYKIVFDSDGLLKARKAAFLDAVSRTYACLLPDEVFQETVVAARNAHPEEAREIEGLIGEGKIVPRRRARSAAADRILRWSTSLGEGECGALRLFYQESADFLVTDDRAFLNLLTRHRIPFLTPAELLVRLRMENGLTPEGAVQAADRLRPFVRRDVYENLRSRLEEMP